MITRVAKVQMGRAWRAGVLLGWLPYMLGGCGFDFDIFDVENRGSLTAADLDDPRLLEPMTLLPEAAGMEHVVNFVRASGMVGNDLTEWQTRAVDLWQDWGLIQLENSTLEALYNNMAADVWIVREARRRLVDGGLNPASDPAIGKSYFWDGHLLVSMADLFEQVTQEGGPPRSPVDTYGDALGILETAVQVLSAAGETHYVAATHGVLARAERQLYYEPGGSMANLASAAQHASNALAAQADYRLEARFVPPGAVNDLALEFGPGRGASPLGVSPVFGEGWYDPATGELDPRMVAWVSPSQASGPQGNMYLLLKYVGPGAPIPVSRWQEAVLIIAEHRLETDDLAGAVDHINMVRNAAGLTAFAGGDAGEIRQQIRHERATEFFAEGRSWQDLRNYGIFPARWNEEGRMLGLHRRIPVSSRERNTNPNF